MKCRRFPNLLRNCTVLAVVLIGASASTLAVPYCTVQYSTIEAEVESALTSLKLRLESLIAFVVRLSLPPSSFLFSPLHSLVGAANSVVFLCAFLSEAPAFDKTDRGPSAVGTEPWRLRPQVLLPLRRIATYLMS
jgi:hypothetical protein